MLVWLLAAPLLALHNTWRLPMRGRILHEKARERANEISSESSDSWDLGLGNQQATIASPRRAGIQHRLAPGDESCLRGNLLTVRTPSLGTSIDESWCDLNTQLNPALAQVAFLACPAEGPQGGSATTVRHLLKCSNPSASVDPSKISTITKSCGVNRRWTLQSPALAWQQSGGACRQLTQPRYSCFCGSSY